MKLNTGSKLALGLATILPLAYLVFFLTYLSPKLASLLGPEHPQHDQYFALFDTVLRLHMAFFVLSFALVAFYGVYLWKVAKVPRKQRSLWAAAIFVGNILTIPVFWYRYVWKGGSLEQRTTLD